MCPSGLRVHAKDHWGINRVPSCPHFLLPSHNGCGKFQRPKRSYNSWHSVFLYPYVHNLKWPLKCLCTSGLPFLNATTWNLNDFQGEPLALPCKLWPANQCSYSRAWCWPFWYSVFKSVTPELSLSMNKHTGHSKTLQNKSLLVSCRKAFFSIPLLKGLASSSLLWNPVVLVLYALSHISCIKWAKRMICLPLRNEYRSPRQSQSRLAEALQCPWWS